jgi:pimeloyl-ACP methyl ester carboxylesterase
MIGGTIMISVPTINVSRLEEVPPQISAPEEPVAAVLMHMLGDLTGRTLLVFPKPTAARLAELMLRRPAGTAGEELGDMEQSAITHVANAKTPTIFWSGERDLRDPTPQLVEMYRALIANGVPTHLYIAPREPHGWGELRHQLFKMNAEIEWFEKWANKRSYTWEKAPGDKDADKPAPKSTEQ